MAADDQERRLLDAWQQLAEDATTKRPDLSHKIAAFYKKRGALEDAERWGKIAILEEERFDRPALLANHLMFLCQVVQQRGWPDEALPLAERALPLYRLRWSESPGEIAYVLSVMVKLCRACDREEEAKNYQREADQIVKQLKNR